MLRLSSGRLNYVHVDTEVIRKKEIVQVYDKVANNVADQNHGKGNIIQIEKALSSKM